MKRKSAMMKKIGLFALAIALPLAAGAHGEDKPGPNGGEIRMPGAFHTEVKKDGGALKIYLLDIQFQNPTVQDSSVEVKVRDGKRESSLTCKPQGQAFACDLPKGEKLEKGELVVKAKRAGAQGNEAKYKLPLLAGAKGGAAPMGGHDHSAHGHNHGGH